jgi:hypothetical protein
MTLQDFNSDRSLLRVTTERIPASFALMKESNVPLGVFVRPYGDTLLTTGEDIPGVSYG